MHRLYRDDDISITSNIGLLMKVHDLFIKYNKIHTITVVMKDIWDNKEIWYWMMTAKNLDIGLHGWEHKDYSLLSYKECKQDIEKSLDYWYKTIERGGYSRKPITTFYPPWHRVSLDLERACKDCKLELDLKQDNDVYIFHYWGALEENRFKQLERELAR